MIKAGTRELLPGRAALALSLSALRQPLSRCQAASGQSSASGPGPAGVLNHRDSASRSRASFKFKFNGSLARASSCPGPASRLASGTQSSGPGAPPRLPPSHPEASQFSGH
eukprot:1442433-Rhodomonas_salina.3